MELEEAGGDPDFSSGLRGPLNRAYVNTFTEHTLLSLQHARFPAPSIARCKGINFSRLSVQRSPP